MTQEVSDVVVRALYAPRILSLCSGIGGLDLGIKRATHGRASTCAYVEIEAFCAGVLAARMEDGKLDSAPIWSDVKSFDGRPWRGIVDCIIGGFPCQPWSLAGKRLGKEDPRHLWPYFVDIIKTIKPPLCFFENVPGLLAVGFEHVCEDLQRLGYSVEAGIFSAAECGAPHLRKRLFFFAYANGADVRNTEVSKQQSTLSARLRNNGSSRNLADIYSEYERCENGTFAAESKRRILSNGWATGDAQPSKGSDIVAHADSQRQLQQGGLVQKERRWSGNGDTGQRVGKPDENTAFSGLGRTVDGFCQGVDKYQWPVEWEHGTPRVTSGQPGRIDRLRALGNAVVPATASLAWQTLRNEILSQ